MPNHQNPDNLRDEIHAFQEQQGTLKVWKLGAIGAVASIALGLSSKEASSQPWLVGLLPFIAIYVDLYVRQLDLRIAVIAKFLRSRDTGIIADYEKAIGSRAFLRLGIWNFNELATIGSTLATAVFVLGYGAIHQLMGVSVAGVTGTALTIGIHVNYYWKFKRLSQYQFSEERDQN